MRFKRTKAELMLITSIMLLLEGCPFYNEAEPNDPKYAPVTPKEMMPPKTHTGSLYQEGYDRPLFGDRKAHRIGDMITIKLVEKTQANKTAKTEEKKDNKLQMVNPTIFGSTPDFTINNNKYTMAHDIDSKRQFKGEGKSDQSNDLKGSITVTVHEILPNGYLKVRGEKWINLNRGDEFIRLTGIVRPDDIDASNSIDSTRVSDARITYSGTGEVADSNHKGWLSRFFFTALFPF